MWLDKLKEMKRSSGMTLQEIADKSNIPKSTIDKLFSGKTTEPYLRSTMAIVHAMGYTVDDLCDETKKAPVKDRDLRKEKLLKNYDNLNDTGKNVLTAQSDYMVTQPEFKKSNIQNSQVAKKKKQA